LIQDLDKVDALDVVELEEEFEEEKDLRLRCCICLTGIPIDEFLKHGGTCEKCNKIITRMHDQHKQFQELRDYVLRRRREHFRRNK
jgi:hypothetical protein